MNIKSVGLAFVAVSVTSGCAGTMETDKQNLVQGAETVIMNEQPAPGESVADDPNAVRCKKIAKAGTRLKTTVCATNAEWKATEENAENTTEKMQQRPQQGRDSG